jgi:hypothetical protein
LSRNYKTETFGPSNTFVFLLKYTLFIATVFFSNYTINAACSNNEPTPKNILAVATVSSDTLIYVTPGTTVSGTLFTSNVSIKKSKTVLPEKKELILAKAVLGISKDFVFQKKVGGVTLKTQPIQSIEKIKKTFFSSLSLERKLYFQKYSVKTGAASSNASYSIVCILPSIPSINNPFSISEIVTEECRYTFTLFDKNLPNNTYLRGPPLVTS